MGWGSFKKVCNDLYDETIGQAQQEGLDTVLQSLYNAVISGSEFQSLFDQLTDSFGFNNFKIIRSLMLKAVGSADNTGNPEQNMGKIIQWAMNNNLVTNQNILSIIEEMFPSEGDKKYKRTALRILAECNNNFNNLLVAIKDLAPFAAASAWIYHLVNCKMSEWSADRLRAETIKAIDSNSWESLYRIAIDSFHNLDNIDLAGLVVLNYENCTVNINTFLTILDTTFPFRNDESVLEKIFDNLSQNSNVNNLMYWVLSVPGSINFDIILKAINKLSAAKQSIWLLAVIMCGFFSDTAALYKRIIRMAIDENLENLFESFMVILKDKQFDLSTIVECVLDAVVPDTYTHGSTLAVVSLPVITMEIQQCADKWLGKVNSVFKIDQDSEKIKSILEKLGPSALNAIFVNWLSTFTSDSAVKNIVLGTKDLSDSLREFCLTILLNTSPYKNVTEKSEKITKFLAESDLNNVFATVMSIIHDWDTLDPSELTAIVVKKCSNSMTAFLNILDQYFHIRSSADSLTRIFQKLSGIDKCKVFLIWVIAVFTTDATILIKAINDLHDDTKEKFWLNLVVICKPFSDSKIFYFYLISAIVNQGFLDLFRIFLKVIKSSVDHCFIVESVLSVLSQAGNSSAPLLTSSLLNGGGITEQLRRKVMAWLDCINDELSISTDTQLIASVIQHLYSAANMLIAVFIGWLAKFNSDNEINKILTAIDMVGSIKETCLNIYLNAIGIANDSVITIKIMKAIVSAGLHELFTTFVIFLVNAQVAVADIVALLLQHVRTDINNWLSRIDSVVSLRTENVVTDIVKKLRSISNGLYDTFISWLLGVEEKSVETFKSCVSIILKIPQKIYSAEVEVESFFNELFTKVVNWVKTKKELMDATMESVFHWIKASVELTAKKTAIPSMMTGLSDISKVNKMFTIAFPAYLAGKALMNIAPDPLTQPDKFKSIVDPFVHTAFKLPEFEDVLLLLARLPGFAIWMLPFLIMYAATRKMGFIDWIGKDIRNLGENGLLIKELDKPCDGKLDSGVIVEENIRRYMIFSDTHRDWPDNDILHKQLFDVSHFNTTKSVYLKALKYCKENHYTVIENGDCEELWYAHLLSPSVKDRAQGIIKTYQHSVYKELKDFYDKGKYFRTCGNHDSFWREGGDDAMQMLKNLFSEDFEIYDALIIPDCLSMAESAWDTTRDVIDNAFRNNEQNPSVIIDRLISESIDKLPLGLSPNRYSEKLPLFILHGHQVDFWNCDEHNILGKVITISLGVPADALDTLPKYLRGIDRDGSPLIKFGDLLYGFNLFDYKIWDNWPDEDVAQRMARLIEQQRECDRHLNDSFSFSETIAASLSLLLGYDSAGALPLPPETWFPGPKLQVVCGHTHFPQSRPYLPMNLIPPGPGIVQNFIKNYKIPYYNTGVASWWENVVWAIEVTEIGQPRLVYWDKHCDTPIKMAWELSAPPIEISKTIKDHLNAVRDIIGMSTQTELPFNTQTIIDSLQKYDSIANVNNMALPQQLEISVADINNRISALGTAIMGMFIPLFIQNEIKPFEFSIDLDKLPENTGGSGVLVQNFEKLNFPMRRLARVWFKSIGIDENGSAWTYLDTDLLKKMGGVLAMLSYFYGKGPLNPIGVLLPMCADVLKQLSDQGRDFKINVKWDYRSGKLTFSGSLGFETKLRLLYETIKEEIPVFIKGLLDIAGNVDRIVTDLMLAPEHIFRNNKEKRDDLFEIIFLSVTRWASNVDRAEVAAKGVGKWLKETMAEGRERITFENPVLPESLRKFDTTEIPVSLHTLARVIGKLAASSECPDIFIEKLFGIVKLTKTDLLGFLKSINTEEERKRFALFLHDHWENVKEAFGDAVEKIKEIIDRLAELSKEGPVIRMLLELVEKVNGAIDEAPDIFNPDKMFKELKNIEDIEDKGSSELWKKLYKAAKDNNKSMKEMLQILIMESSSISQWFSSMASKIKSICSTINPDYKQVREDIDLLINKVGAFFEDLWDFAYLGGSGIDKPFIIDITWVENMIDPLSSDLKVKFRIGRLVLPGPADNEISIIEDDSYDLPEIYIPFVSSRIPKVDLTVKISHLPEFHVLDARYRLPYGASMGYQVADLDSDGSVEDWEVEMVRQATAGGSYDYKLDCNKDGQVTMEDVALAHQQRDLYVNGLMYRNTTAPLGILIGWRPTWLGSGLNIWFFAGVTSLHEESIPDKIARIGELWLVQGHFQLAPDDFQPQINSDYQALNATLRSVLDRIFHNWIQLHYEYRNYFDTLVYELPAEAVAALPSLMNRTDTVIRFGHQGKDLQIYGATDYPGLFHRTFNFSFTAYIKALVTGFWAVYAPESGAGVAGQPAVRLKLTYQSGQPLAAVISQWTSMFNGIFETPHMVRRLLEESMLLRIVRTVSRIAGPSADLVLGWLDNRHELKGLLEYLRQRSDGYKPGRTWKNLFDEIKSWTDHISTDAIEKMLYLAGCIRNRMVAKDNQPVWTPKAACSYLIEAVNETSTTLTTQEKTAVAQLLTEYFKDTFNFVAGFEQIITSMLNEQLIDEDWNLAIPKEGYNQALGLLLEGTDYPYTSFTFIDPGVLAYWEMNPLTDKQKVMKKPLFRSVIQLAETGLYTVPISHDSVLVQMLPEGSAVTVEGSFALVEEKEDIDEPKSCWFYVRAGYSNYGWVKGCSDFRYLRNMSQGGAIDLDQERGSDVVPAELNIIRFKASMPDTLDYSPFVPAIRNVLETESDGLWAEEIKFLYIMIMSEIKLEMWGPPGVADASDALVYDVLSRLDPVERGAFWIQKNADIKCIYYSLRLLKVVIEHIIKPITENNQPDFEYIEQQVALWQTNLRKEEVFYSLDSAGNGLLDLLQLLIQTIITAIPSMLKALDSATTDPYQSYYKKRFEEGQKKTLNNILTASPGWILDPHNYDQVVDAAIKRVAFIIHDTLSDVSSFLADKICPVDNISMEAQPLDHPTEPKSSTSFTSWGYPTDVYEQRRAYEEKNRDTVAGFTFDTSIGADKIIFEITIEADGGAGVGDAINNSGGAGSITGGGKLKTPSIPMPMDLLLCRGIDSIGAFIRFMLRNIWHSCNAIDMATGVQNVNKNIEPLHGWDLAATTLKIASDLAPVFALEDIVQDHPGFVAALLEQLYIAFSIDFNVTATGIAGADFDISETVTPTVWVHFGGLVGALLEFAGSTDTPSDSDIADRLVPRLRFTLCDKTMAQAGTVPVSFEVISCGQLIEAEIILPQGSDLRTVVGGWFRKIGEEFRRIRNEEIPKRPTTMMLKNIIDKIDGKVQNLLFAGPPENPDSASSPDPKISTLIETLTTHGSQVTDDRSPSDLTDLERAKEVLTNAKVIGIDAAPGRILDADPQNERFRISVFVNDDEFHSMVVDNGFESPALPMEQLRDLFWEVPLPFAPDTVEWQSRSWERGKGLAAGFVLFDTAKEFAKQRNSDWVRDDLKENVWTQDGKFWAWIETQMVDKLQDNGIAVPVINLVNESILRLEFLRVNVSRFDFTTVDILINKAPVKEVNVHRVVLLTSSVRRDYLALEKIIKENRKE